MSASAYNGVPRVTRKFRSWLHSPANFARVAANVRREPVSRFAHYGLSNFATSHWIPLVDKLDEQVFVANRSPKAAITDAPDMAYPLFELADGTHPVVNRVSAIAEVAALKDDTRSFRESREPEFPF